LPSMVVGTGVDPVTYRFSDDPMRFADQGGSTVCPVQRRFSSTVIERQDASLTVPCRAEVARVGGWRVPWIGRRGRGGRRATFHEEWLAWCGVEVG
jgi:hypothetical protein